MIDKLKVPKFCGFSCKRLNYAINKFKKKQAYNFPIYQRLSLNSKDETLN